MLVTLDGQRLDDAFEAGASLQAVIDRVRASRLADRLVVGVAIDGRPLVDEELRTSLAQPVADGTQIDLESGDVRELVLDALREAAGRLDEAAAGMGEIADVLQSGETARAVGQFGEVLGVWQVCRQTLAECGPLMPIDLETETFAGRPIAQHLAELVETLRELRGAFNAQDMVLLADQIRYEMPALCETWRDLLTHVAAQAERGATGV